VDKVRAQSDSIGFNALTDEYEDLVAAGIIDPTMVTRSALQNAASIGSLIVTTDVVVAEPEGEILKRYSRDTHETRDTMHRLPWENNAYLCAFLVQRTSQI
jgi:chaperonin GroEL (HSP60 family)